MTTNTADSIKKWTVDLGKVDAKGNGRKSNRVTLEVELRHKVNDTAPYLDIHLQPCRHYTELSICGAIWNAAGTDHWSGGQNHETIAALFPNDKRVQALVAIWKRWHLNGMKPGCLHQIHEKWAERPLDPSKPTDAYVDHGDGHQGWNMLTWVPKSAKHPNGLLSEPCPACGYKYGSAWLVEALPEMVQREIAGLCDNVQADSYERPAEPKDFATKHGITATSRTATKNPNFTSKENDGSHHYYVTLCRTSEHGEQKLSVYFSKGSAHGFERPTALEVLGCLASDTSTIQGVRSFEEWCRELGYETDSRSAEKTYNTCRKQADDLKVFLGQGLLRELLEDSN